MVDLLDTDPDAVALAATTSVDAGFKDTVPEPKNVEALLQTSTVFSPEGEARVRATRDVGTFSLGDVVGDRYVITEELGQGGCGFVYAAHDRQLDVAVALKTLRPDVHLTEDAVSELKSEILMARKVTHGNVCRIFDFGVHEGEAGMTCFMTMELIRGETLADKLERDGKISLPELVPIAKQVLAALDAAHDAGVVHADLKPGNILLTSTDEGVRAVVTDFGLATAHTSDISDSARAAFGTPAYMAPEQVEGRRLTPAADYYALGCTLFHALSGKFPFIAPSAYETAVARLEQSAPRLSDVSDVSGKWVDIVAGLMARRETDRLTSDDVRSTLDPRPRRRRLQLVAAVVASAVVATAIALWVTREQIPERLELSTPDDPLAAELLERGEDLLAMRLRTSAAAELRRANKLEPNHPRILARLAEATHTKRLEKPPSHALIRRAVELTAPGDERDYYRTIEMRLTNDRAELTDLLGRLAAKYPKDTRFGINLVSEYLNSGLTELARKTLAAMSPVGPLETVRYKVADVRFAVHVQEYEAAVAKAEDARQYATDNKMPIYAAVATAAAAMAHRHLGHPDQARELGEQVLELADATDTPSLVLEANKSLLPIAMSRHDFARALDLVRREREALEALGDVLARDQLRITHAEVLTATGDTRRALDEVNTVLPLLRDARIYYWEGYAQLVRSGIQTHLAEPALAANDCEAGTTLYRSIKAIRLEAYALALCGHAHLTAGRLDDAERALQASTKIRQERNLGFLVAQNSLLVAEIAMARGRLEIATETATGATEFLQSQKLVNDEVQGRLLLARLALRSGELEAARSHLARAKNQRLGTAWEPEIEITVIEALLDVTENRDPESAVAHLETAVKRAATGGYVFLELNASMALATALEATGKTEQAVELRAETTRRAKSKGVVLWRFVAS